VSNKLTIEQSIKKELAILEKELAKHPTEIARCQMWKLKYSNASNKQLDIAVDEFKEALQLYARPPQNLTDKIAELKDLLLQLAD
jgi:hypothetical protein